MVYRRDVPLMRLGLRWQLLLALLGLLTATVILISLVMLQLSERTLALQAAAGMEQSFSIVVDDAAAELDLDAARIQQRLGARSVIVCDSGTLVSAAHD